MSKKVLIITYYWPPRGGAGVFRWLKFSKYLPDFGVQPIIFTPKNGEAQMIDYSLKKQVPENLKVIKTRIVEPFGLYKSFMGLKKSDRISTGFLKEKAEKPKRENFALWVRSNFFIPDARVWWVRPSYKYLKAYLQQNPVDAIITTGPPHSLHLIGYRLNQALKTPWIADFRDPWTNIDWFDKLKLTKRSLAKHKLLELQVLKNATKVVTVSQSWAKDFEQLSGRKIDVITNGFDPDDFDFLGVPQKNENEFVVVHAGSLNADRNPIFFWQSLSDLRNRKLIDTLKIKLIGPVDQSVFQPLLQYNLLSCVEHIKQLPHKEIPAQLKAADILLLPLNNTKNTQGIIPGKLFEYLAANRPILAIGSPQGDSAKIIKETGVGEVLDFNEPFTKEHLTGLKSGFNPNKNKIDNYSRKKLAKDYANLILSLQYCLNK